MATFETLFSSLLKGNIIEIDYFQISLNKYRVL